MRQCRNRYILADSSKFGSISAVTFAALEDAVILTDEIPEGYQKENGIVKCGE